MLDWLRPKTATIAELETQFAAARDAHAAAQSQTAEAVDAFDDAGDAKTASNLARARKAEEEAWEHVGRASRLLEKARDAKAAAEREDLLREMKQLEEQELSDPALTALRAPLDAEEASLYVQLAELSERRETLAREVHRKTHRRDWLHERLFNTDSPSRGDRHSSLVLQSQVLTVLQTELATATGARATNLRSAIATADTRRR